MLMVDMAVTKIWPIKGRVDKVIDYARNPEKTRESSYDRQEQLHTIDGVVEYAADEMKTETRAYVTCINCREDMAAKQFMETKDYWTRVSGRNKFTGRVCFHAYQSFADQEITAEAAHEIGVKLAERMWGDRFEIVVATHCNTSHYHNHFVINSVSYKDGLKFDCRLEDYKRMRQESDRLCQEYGLSVIEEPAGRGRNYGEYLAEKNGKPTYRGTIRQDIDLAIVASMTEREFFHNLEEKGYEIKLYGSSGKLLKHPGLKPAGAKGYFRFHSLGEGYDLESLTEKILQNRRRRNPFPEEEKQFVQAYRREHQPKEKAKGLHALYLRYCFELHILYQFPASYKKVSFYMREDLTRLDKLDQQTRFLGENHIETIDDLTQIRERIKSEMEDLSKKRKGLRNDLKRHVRSGDQDGIIRVKKDIEEVSKKMKELRHEVKLCDSIEDRSSAMNQEMIRLSQMEAKEAREEERHEYVFGGRSRTSRENVA